MIGHIEGFYNERELGKKLGLSVWGLRSWRKREYGPKSVKMGKLVLYSENEVTSFLLNLSREG